MSAVNGNNESGKVLDLASYRQKKDVAAELGHGRKPLYLDQSTGMIRKSPETAEGQQHPDFGERLQRIRSSLDRINSLMSELRTLAQKDKLT